MLVVTVSKTGIPSGTPWPGVFLSHGKAYTHIVSAADEKEILAKLGQSAAAKISYEQHLGFVASAK